MRITDRTVLIGTDSREGHVYSWDKETGDLNWKFAAGRGVATDIVLEGKRVFALTFQDTLLCLDPDSGEELWHFDTGSDPSARLSMGSTPVLLDGLVVFGGLDGFVFALSAETGSLRWTTDVGSQVTTATHRLGDHVLVGTEFGEIYKIRADSGRVESVMEVPFRTRGHFITLPDGNVTVFLTESDWEGALTTFTPDLEPRWTAYPTDGTTFTSSRPFLLGTMVLVGTRGGNVYALDPVTGEAAWSFAVDPAKDWSDGGVRVFGADPSTLYVGTMSGEVYAFRMSDLPIDPFR